MNGKEENKGIHLFRGNLVYRDSEGEYRYVDTDELTSETHMYRPCGYCMKFNTKEGYDACLGALPKEKVMNACCGHGEANKAYVQYWDGNSVQGIQAVHKQKLLKLERDTPKKKEILDYLDSASKNAIVRYLVYEGILKIPKGLSYYSGEAHNLISKNHLSLILNTHVDRMRFIGRKRIANIEYAFSKVDEQNGLR